MANKKNTKKSMLEAADHIAAAIAYAEANLRESVYERLGRNYYKTTVPYPDRKDFHIEEEVVTKKLGTQTLKGFDREGYDAAMKAYREDNARLADEFKVDALEEVGLTGHLKADKCFSLAEEHGHSSGYADVMCYLVDFADLVK